MIIRERAGLRLAVLVVGYLLEQRRTDALRHTPANLAVDNHRINDGAAVFSDGVISWATSPVSGSTETTAACVEYENTRM